MPENPQFRRAALFSSAGFVHSFIRDGLARSALLASCNQPPVNIEVTRARAY